MAGSSYLLVNNSESDISVDILEKKDAIRYNPTFEAGQLFRDLKLWLESHTHSLLAICGTLTVVISLITLRLRHPPLPSIASFSVPSFHGTYPEGLEAWALRLERERMTADFWTVKPVSFEGKNANMTDMSEDQPAYYEYEISPATDYLDSEIPLGLLDHAIFKARLVHRREAGNPDDYHNRTHPVTIQSLLDPVLHTNQSYLIQIPATIPGFAQGTYTLEVFLVYGWYPTRDGQPCATVICNPRKDFDPAMKMSYKLIQPVHDVSISMSTPRIGTESLDNVGAGFRQTCLDYPALSGFWHGNHFHTYDSSCDLPSDGDINTFLYDSLPENQVTWLHTVGDSVVRYAAEQLMHELALPYKYNITVSGNYHPTYWLGTGQFPGNRTMLITFSWWFRIPEKSFGASLFPLEKVLDPHSPEEVFPWEGVLDFSAPPFSYEPYHKPNYTFLAFGSHSPETTILGMQTHWNQIKSLVSSIDDDRLCLLSTTPVDQRRVTDIALKTMRNDLNIQARNAEMVKHAEELGLPVLDWHSLASGTEWDYYNDHLHPGKVVQKGLARAMLGQFMRTKIQ